MDLKCPLLREEREKYVCSSTIDGGEIENKEYVGNMCKNGPERYVGCLVGKLRKKEPLDNPIVYLHVQNTI